MQSLIGLCKSAAGFAEGVSNITGSVVAVDDLSKQEHVLSPQSPLKPKPWPRLRPETLSLTLNPKPLAQQEVEHQKTIMYSTLLYYIIPILNEESSESGLFCENKAHW